MPRCVGDDQRQRCGGGGQGGGDTAGPEHRNVTQPDGDRVAEIGAIDVLDADLVRIADAVHHPSGPWGHAIWADDLDGDEDIDLVVVADYPYDSQNLYVLLNNGDATFDDLARLHSLRPGADETGGFLGWVRRNQAGLLADLDQRGLLDETLVIWGGEFGRTPMGERRKPTGRDHHVDCFTVWLAGGGVRAGITYGRTDDYGYNIADADGNPLKPQPNKESWTPGTMHIHDLNATILHLLGIDHKRLTYRYQGRDFRLPDVHGQLVPEILRNPDITA